MSSLAEAAAELIARVTRLEGPVVAVLARLLVVSVALAAGFLAYRALGRVIERLLRRAEGASDDPGRAQRAQTLAPLLKNVALYALSFTVAMVILQEMGVDMRAILVSAGVLGLAVGFGAQALIKDVIAGFFILFEGLVRVGDVIEVSGHTGTVETIGLRVTTMRVANGALRVVPNGELTQFANYNRGWARAMVDVGVTYDTDVRRALDALERAGREWSAEAGLALEPPRAQGIIRFGESEVGLRLVVKVAPAARNDAEIELRRRIKEAFDREGLELAAPQRAIYLKPQVVRT
ncbi:MAG TPA: mechanosensitive ion channel family protein [Candidatus Eisenbacteria bacterium]|nr:mechanosensitive ion channel family protein [Candidatus Eisenbacteria bacterium]